MKKQLVFTLFTLILITACSSKLFKDKWTQQEAPASFKARFETTQGSFDIVAQRSLSPEAVDRLYQLIKNEFYTDVVFFRVLPNFVIQFGIHGNPEVNKKWEAYKIPDEPVLESNDSLTISFARGGVESRTTQIFVNMKNNNRLDDLDYNGVKGFPVVAKVTDGADTLYKLYSDYGGKPADQQEEIYTKGNAFLKENYPKLDYIIKAYIVK
ncbi:hypothetical protein KH5_21830 [Urechidicola sp. KH5]